MNKENFCEFRFLKGFQRNIHFLDVLCRWMVIEYYLFRTENNILILQQLDFFGRTSELAKLFGIQFYEVLSRGSQVSEVIYFSSNTLSSINNRIIPSPVSCWVNDAQISKNPKFCRDVSESKTESCDESSGVSATNYGTRIEVNNFLFKTAFLFQ